jgi:hypothetical protein
MMMTVIKIDSDAPHCSASEHACMQCQCIRCVYSSIQWCAAVYGCMREAVMVEYIKHS